MPHRVSAQLFSSQFVQNRLVRQVLQTQTDCSQDRAHCLVVYFKLQASKNISIRVWINRAITSDAFGCDCRKIFVRLEMEINDGALSGNTFQVRNNCRCGRVAMTSELLQQCCTIYRASQLAMERDREYEEGACRWFQGNATGARESTKSRHGGDLNESQCEEVSRRARIGGFRDIDVLTEDAKSEHKLLMTRFNSCEDCNKAKGKALLWGRTPEPFVNASTKSTCLKTRLRRPRCS